MSIRAQLQDLGGIMGPPLQDRPEVLHSLTVIWLDKPSERPPSTVWPNGLKTEWLAYPKVDKTDKSYMNTTWLRLGRPSCIYTPINAQIVHQTRSILTITIIRKHFILNGLSWQDNRYESKFNVIISRNQAQLRCY